MVPAKLLTVPLALAVPAEGVPLVARDGVGNPPLVVYYAANRFCAAEHGGTHLDAPIHFSENAHSPEEIPVEQLVGLGVVVDVSEKCASDRDYRVQVVDLQAWEGEHGRLPEGAIVLLRTGWAERWGDREGYLGTARTGPAAVAELHFPGLHSDAARWLVTERKVKRSASTPPASTTASRSSSRAT